MKARVRLAYKPVRPPKAFLPFAAAPVMSVFMHLCLFFDENLNVSFFILLLASCTVVNSRERESKQIQGKSTACITEEKYLKNC